MRPTLTTASRDAAGLQPRDMPLSMSTTGPKTKKGNWSRPEFAPPPMQNQV